MTMSRPLPLLSGGRCGAAACHWKCGDECAHGSANSSGNEPFAAVVEHGLSRRRFLQSLAAATVVVASPVTLADPAAAQARPDRRRWPGSP